MYNKGEFIEIFYVSAYFWEQTYAKFCYGGGFGRFTVVLQCGMWRSAVYYANFLLQKGQLILSSGIDGI